MLKAIEVLIEKFGGHANDERTFAIALGHKTNKSGMFLRKIADLRKYGLIESRGLIATKRAKHIVNPFNAKERNKEINETLMSVPLWKSLYGRLKGKLPTIEDFKIHLSEVTGDRDKSISHGDEIRNFYKGVLDSYTSTTEETVSKDSSEGGLTPEQQPKREFPPKEAKKMSEDVILLRSGDVNLSLPKTEANIDIVCNVLQGMTKGKEIKKSG